ncbi:MAG: hypothetical protein AB1568_04870 [Thermodesulfobacteriota bacterium]
MAHSAHIGLAHRIFPDSKENQAACLTFFEEIDADPDLTNIAQVCQRLLKLQPLLLRIAPQALPAGKSVLWQTICRSIIQLHQTNALATSKKHDKKKKGMHGLHSYFPVYCALATLPHRSLRQDIAERYLQLQAYLLYSHLTFRHFQRDPSRKFISNRENASRSIRQLANESLILARLPRAILSPTDFHKKLEDLKDDVSLSEKEHSLFTFLERLLAHATGARKGHRETREKPIRAEKKLIAAKRVVISDYTGEDADTGPSPPTLRLYHHSTCDQNEAREAQREGLDPAENYSGPTVATSVTFPRNDSRKANQSAAVRIINQHRHLANANQLLAIGWGKLSLPELHSFFVGLEKLYNHKYRNHGMTWDESNQFVAIMAAMYYTSSSFSRAILMRVCSSIEQIPQHIGPDNEIYFCLSEQCWVIPEPKVSGRKKAKKSWKYLVEQVHSRIFLPAPSLCREFLSRWCKSRHVGEKSTPFFDLVENKFEKDFKRFQSLLGQKEQPRLTAARISGHLSHYIADVTGDTAISACLFGQPPAGSQRTSLYYFSPKREDLQDIYMEVCKSIERPLLHLMKSTPKLPDAPPIPQSDRIGSAICPKPQTVALLVKDLRDMINYRRSDRLHQEYLVSYHNAFVAYCLVMLGFMTGYRAVRDPLHDESNIDWQSGFIVISDKDDNVYYNSRIAWLPPVCLAQLREYRRYRYSLIEPIALLNNTLSETLKIQLIESDHFSWKSTERSNTSTKSHGNNQYKIPFFFFLRNGYKIENISNSTLSSKIKWTYPLPLNANRHYLRTKLSEYGVPGEIIDAYMGHWDRGREPYGKFSSLSPADFRTVLQEPLTRISKEAGWITVKAIF